MTPARTENLPHLIERAAAMLAKAATAGEILEARDQADVAYTAAKMAARLSKMKGAHDTVINTCRQTMADALVIEARAQCRLADEYDEAQKRGEIAKLGTNQTEVGVLNKNTRKATTADIGLTRKQVHEARQVRDAEKTTPGIVRKTVEEKLKSDEEPTRADVRRATHKVTTKNTEVKSSPAPKSSPTPSRAPAPRLRTRSDGKSKTPKLDLARDIVRPLLWNDEPCNPRTLETQHDISHVHFETAIAVERALMDEPPIDASTLPMSAQEKLNTAIKNATRKLEAEIEHKVRAEVQRWLTDDLLPMYRQKEATYNLIIKSRKGALNNAEYKLIWSCLHTDSRKSVSDEKLNKAFHLFTKLEKLVLDEKESPTLGNDLPKTAVELLRRKAEYDARRAAERAARRGASANVARR